MITKVRNFQDVLDSRLDFLMSDVNGNEIKDPQDWSWSLIEVQSDINENEKKFIFIPFMQLR